MDYNFFISKNKYFLFENLRILKYKKNLVQIINKDKNDKEFEEIEEVKRYFARKYSVLSKEIREKLKHLKISQKKKKSLKKVLAFLPEEKQHKYLDELE